MKNQTDDKQIKARIAKLKTNSGTMEMNNINFKVPDDSEYFRFYIREIVYDFYIAGIGDRSKIEKLQRIYSRFWKDD